MEMESEISKKSSLKRAWMDVGSYRDSESKLEVTETTSYCYPYTPIPYFIFPASEGPPAFPHTDDDVDMDVDMDTDTDMDMDMQRERGREMSPTLDYYDTAWEEPLFHHVHRPSYYYPSIPSQLKVRRVEDDDLLQQLIDAQPRFLPPSDFNMLAKLAVAWVLFNDMYSTRLWKMIRANSFELFISVIIAAASIVCKLYSKISLVQIAFRPKTYKQIYALWDDITWMRKEYLSFPEICEKIVELMTNVKYSSVTQPELDAMVNFYRSLFCNRKQLPHFTFQYPHITLFDDLDEDGVMHQIACALACEEYPPDTMKADDHALWLMEFLRGAKEKKDINSLIDDAMQFVTLPKLDSKDILELEKQEKYDIDTQERLNKILNIRDVLKSMTCCVKLKIKCDLMDVKRPLLELYKYASIQLPPEIIEVVQVAEIRRRDLGCRFIGRSHLIWAFYKLKYGFPPNFRDQIKVHPDEDHPPYHIYLGAILLTLYLGEKITQLEHFMFVVIHSKYIGFGGEKVTELVENFKQLRKDAGLLERSFPRQ